MPVDVGHFPLAFERRLNTELFQAKRFMLAAVCSRHQSDFTRSGVHAVELLFVEVVIFFIVRMLHIGAAKHLLRLDIDQERKVRIVLHKFRLVQFFGQDRLDDRHRQDIVGTGFNRDPEVGGLGRRIELRRNDDDLRAVVLAFPYEVRIRDTRNRRVAAPHNRRVDGIHEVPRTAKVTLAVGDRRTGEHVPEIRRGIDTVGTKLRGETQRSTAAPFGKKTRTRMYHQFVRPAFRVGLTVEDLLADLLCRFIPTDTFPFTFAALADPLHRVEDTVFLVHDLRVLDTLVTTARVEVGDLRIDDRVARRLVFTGDDAVMRPHFPRTVPLAVDTVVCVPVLLFFPVREGKLVAVHLFGVVGVRVVVLAVFNGHDIRFCEKAALRSDQRSGHT